MLERCARLFKFYSADGKPEAFSDSITFADWATDAIGFVSSVRSSEGTAIMGGTGDGYFSPLDAYTREQSILTVWRLFCCI